MKAILLSIVVCFLTISAIAHQSFIDPTRYWQIIPSTNEKVLLQTRMEEKNGYRYQLNVADIDGAVIPLPIAASEPMVASWGPHAHEVSFIERSKNGWSLIIYHVTKRTKRTLLTTKENVLALKYSPSRAKLALIVRKKDEQKPYYLEGGVKPKNSLLIFDLAVKRFKPIATDNQSIDTDVRWFKDNSRLVVTLRPSLEYFDSWHSQIAVLDLRGEAFSLLTTSDGLHSNPRIAPDELTIAFVTNRPYSAERPDVFQFARFGLYDLVKNEATLLPETADASPELIGFSADGTSLVYTEARAGSISLNTIAISKPFAKKSLRVEDGIVRSITLSDDAKTIAFVEEAPLEQASPCVMSLINFTKRCKQKEKSEDLANITYESIHYPARDGTIINAILVKPKNSDGPFPTIVVAHGGPTYHSYHQYVGHLNSLVNPFIAADFAKKGFAVIAPNIRGSIGYGPEMRCANYEDLGGKDFHDLLDSVDFLIKKGIAHKEKLGVFGWSYGGYLCTLAATQTQLFKAAVCGAAISDWLTHARTSAFKAYTSGYFGSKYSHEISGNNILYQRSPALTMRFTNTPTLLLHGNRDNAVDFGQTLEMFWALKQKNAVVELAVFPNEQHALTKPESLKSALLLVETWFAKYLNVDRETIK